MSIVHDDEENDYEASVPMTGSIYANEDTNPTTDRELRGWYAYPIAAEVFAVVAVGESPSSQLTFLLQVHNI